MILRGTPGTIRVQWGDADNPANPGTVTIGITRGDGTVLVAAGAATVGTGTDPRTFTLSTVQTAQVDELKATWTSPTLGAVVTYHPVVGGFYVDLMTLRGAGDLPESKFLDETLDAARDWWLTLVDDYCGQSFVPMWRLWRSAYPWRGGILRLDRPNIRTILSASIGGTVVDTTGWVASDSGRVYTSTGGNPTVTGSGFLTVAFEHGHNQPDPELYQTGIAAMRSKLLTDRTGGPLPRQLSVTNEFGTQIVRIAQPGEDRATPWPDINAVLNRRRAATEIVSIGA